MDRSEVHDINSIGMRMVTIPAGCYTMGEDSPLAEWDEQPLRHVTISHPFSMGATEVTNAQYELFDPSHRAQRGQRGISADDDEAVVFVSWNDARRFCAWLSKREHKPYRLPTEAEWEYACRAGTNSSYCCGAALTQDYVHHPEGAWGPSPVNLNVALSKPNAFGLYDMHGNVEEWCADWYGPYSAQAQADPVGYASGLYRVTRGGSHNTMYRYLRSANRSGAMPDDRSWIIGFRVVQADMPRSKPLPAPPRPLWARKVSRKPAAWTPAHVPVFDPPMPYVHIPAGANGPLYAKHNHCPAITWCANGDLLAVWFSCNDEAGREMTIAASRLRAGAGTWDHAEVFFKVPDRNMTGSSLINDGKGTLYFLNGVEAASGWANLAIAKRVSHDNGTTWSTPVWANAQHQPRNQVIAGGFITREGWFVQPCDAVSGGSGGSAVHISRDGGKTWTDPGAATAKPSYTAGATGHTIAGIHAGVVQLQDGSLMAYGRSDNIADDHGVARMPRSLSTDMGANWTYSASPWPPISSGQRLVLRRLNEGALLFVSFTDSSDNLAHPTGMVFARNDGSSYTGYGLYAAVSYDDGKTWPIRRLLTDGVDRRVKGGAWTGEFVMDATHAEPRGYLAATQSPDGIIHLVSSGVYYRFNLAWLTGKP